MNITKTVNIDIADSNIMRYLENMRTENTQALKELVENADMNLLSFIANVYLSKLYKEDKQAYYDWIKVLNVVHKEELEKKTEYKVGQKFTLTMNSVFSYIKVDCEIKRVDDRNYYFTTCVNPRSKLSYMSKKRFAAEIGKTIELLD